MSWVIKIVGTPIGIATEHDGEYLAYYDVAAFNGRGEIRTHPDIQFAQKFSDVQAALDCWRQSYGMRPDGKPNRPLTAFTVSVEPA